MRIPNRVLLAGLLAASQLTATAAETPALDSIQLRTSTSDQLASDLAWKENKLVPAGMMMVMVHGDPSKAGPYVFRAKIPAGYKLPPHRHPDERSVVVLKGTYWSGAGENYDRAGMKKFTPGHYYVTDANTPHFAFAETDVIIQEMGVGPVVVSPIEFVHTEDDPRAK